MLNLRNDNPVNNKLHRERPLYTNQLCRIAERAMKYVRSPWRAERLIEVNQMAWNATPCCSSPRVFNLG